jgi:hypothetical protein
VHALRIDRRKITVRSHSPVLDAGAGLRLLVAAVLTAAIWNAILAVMQ